MAGVEDTARLHAMAEANRRAEREKLLGDPALRITRIHIDWPWNIRRTWLDLFGVVATYVCNVLLWSAFTAMVWREFPQGAARAVVTAWPMVFALSNVRLLAEEVWRQWKVS